MIDREILARAAEWRLLGLLFERPTPIRTRWLDGLLREVRNPALRALAENLRDLDEGTYLALLGPGGAASPREVAYRWHDDPGWILADLADFYSAFGYRPEAEDPADHVAVEAGFVAYLCLKEAYAQLRGGGAEVTSEARERFLATHLSTLAAGLVSRLPPESPLAPAARMLVERIGPRYEADRHVRIAEDEAPHPCGPCAG